MRFTISKFPTLKPADREDMAQEIRIALLLHGGKAPWLVARRRAIDWWRHTWGRKNHSIGYMQHEIPFAFEGADNERGDEATDFEPAAPPSVDPIEMRDLDRWLETVGTRNAEFLVLCYGHGMKHREISERGAGIGEAGVSWAINESLRKLGERKSTRIRSSRRRRRTSA